MVLLRGRLTRKGGDSGARRAADDESSFYALSKADHSIPSWRTAARTVPSFRSRPPQSGMTVERFVLGLCHLRCEPLPLRGIVGQPKAVSFRATTRYFMECLPEPRTRSVHLRRAGRYLPATTAPARRTTQQPPQRRHG